jgi:hypothetical protein
MSSHKWTSFPTHKKSTVTLSWPFCYRCGLIRLKNQISIKAANDDCRTETLEQEERQYNKYKKFFKD